MTADASAEELAAAYKTLAVIQHGLDPATAVALHVWPHWFVVGRLDGRLTQYRIINRFLMPDLKETPVTHCPECASHIGMGEPHRPPYYDAGCDTCEEWRRANSDPCFIDTEEMRL